MGTDRQPRAVRVNMLRARVQVANTFADLVNLSRTGALIHTNQELRPGSEWPLVLELPAEPVRCTARVVRCEPAEQPLAGSGVMRTLYAATVTFVQPSTGTQQILERVCGPAIESGD